MKGEGFLGIIAILICAPIAFGIIKAFVIDIVINTYKDSYKGTPKAKEKAIWRAIINGIIGIVFLALVALCSYSPDSGGYDERDHYDEYRNEPGW